MDEYSIYQSYEFSFMSWKQSYSWKLWLEIITNLHSFGWNEISINAFTQLVLMAGCKRDRCTARSKDKAWETLWRTHMEAAIGEKATSMSHVYVHLNSSYDNIVKDLLFICSPWCLNFSRHISCAIFLWCS